MSNLLKDSIADAKNLKQLAMDNARVQLEESFIPRIQSIVSKKLREEEENEMEDEEMLDTDDSSEMEDEVSEEEIPTEDDEELSEEEEIESELDDETSEEEIESEDEDEEIEDAELEEIIKELEDEMADEEEVSLEEMEDEIESELDDEASDDEDEEIDLEEMEDEIESEDGDEDEEIDLEEIFGKTDNNQITKLRKENTKLKTALKYMSKQINEVSLLNSKLLYTNKLFRKFNLAETQKRKVINTFDRTKTLREVKLVYSSLTETFTGSKVKRNAIRENFASKKTASTKPNKLVENKNPLADRLKQLANIK